MQLNISVEDIETYVKNALIQSSIGKALEEGITKYISGYDSQFGKDMKSIISKLSIQIIEKHFGAEFEKQIAAKIKEQFTEEFISGSISSMISKMVRAIDENNNRY